MHFSLLTRRAICYSERVEVTTFCMQEQSIVTPAVVGRPFLVGNPDGRAGRKPGPNKSTIEIRAAAKLLVEDELYRKNLLARITLGEAPHMEVLLWHYAYGKPKDLMEVKDQANHLEHLDAAQLEAHALVLAAAARSVAELRKAYQEVPNAEI
jgi:hypothetical protein